MYSLFQTKTLTLLAILFAGVSSVMAQVYPETPNSVQFGGITVKFDKSAKTTIESDIKALMSNRRYWEEKMDRAILYFPIIEGVLIEQEVPIDFKYLAVQESSLNPDAVSTSNAIGFWQFKRETATEMGLRADNEIDERKNISSSTLAAARYVKRSNQQFNNWVSSLYSYYLGMGGIKNIIPANWSGAREVTLTGKTDRYVLRFFAHKIALEAGLDTYRTSNSIVLLETTSKGQRSFSELAQNLNINESELKKYNRWTENDRIPTDKEYVLIVPVSSTQINSVKEKLSITRQDTGMDNIRSDIGFPIVRKTSQKGRDGHVFYEINGLPGVQALPGDTPSSLAKAGRVSVSKLMFYNDQTGNEPIIPDDIYYLGKKAKKAKVPFHTVRNGETLRRISQTYGIRLKFLLKYNRINNRTLRLQTGRVLYLNKKRPSNQPIVIIEKPELDQNQPIQPSSPQTLAGQNDIPKNASERKKYSPKLGEQASAPTGTAGNSKNETTINSSSPSSSSTTTPASNDRVVIITEGETRKISTTNDSWKEEPKTTPAKTVTKASSPKSANTSLVTTVPNKEFHSVAPGQTYFSISKLYNLSIDDLLRLNNLTTNDKLYVGQKLRIRKSDEFSTNTPDNTVAETLTHTVVTGETLFRISQIYKVGIDEIKRLNNLSDNTVKIGQKLLIPKK